MARGDECKTASRANHAVKQLDVSAPMKKQESQKSMSSAFQPAKKPEQKNYGSWGPIFKDKKTFTDMHFC